jgi:hypothetical protein
MVESFVSTGFLIIRGGEKFPNSGVHHILPKGSSLKAIILSTHNKISERSLNELIWFPTSDQFVDQKSVSSAQSDACDSAKWRMNNHGCDSVHGCEKAKSDVSHWQFSRPFDA